MSVYVGDRAVLNLIQDGAVTFSAISSAAGAPYDRGVDRALQRCRKKGYIKYNKQKRKWEITTKGRALK